MCKDTEHDFEIVACSSTEITEDGGVTYFRPATIFCRKCGYYTHIKACHHRGPAEPIPPHPFKEEEYFDPVKRVFKR